jgi:dTDP-4-dehydrorhamnose 3,5-epimerase-like enzyme
LEDDVYVGPNATFTNDLYPRSKAYPAEFAKTIVRQGASIGANATILPGLEIGASAMVGAGAVVTRSVPPNAVVVGNPARISGYVNATELPGSAPDIVKGANAPKSFTTETGVGNATLHELNFVEDLRGNLSAGEFGRDIPFTPKRYFVVFDVPSKEVRGEHAHKTCQQFLVCVSGSVSVLLDDGKQRCEVRLDRPNRGIHVPPMVWGTQYRYSADCVLLVFASHYYDPDDYIRTYREYLNRLLEEKPA